MFVVERLIAAAEIREQSEMDVIIQELATADRRPLLRSMAVAGAKAADLAGTNVGVGALISRDPRLGPNTGPVGDVLFVVTGGVADRCYLVQPFQARLLVLGVRHHCVPSRINEFCGAVEGAIRKRIDGRRVRGMNFVWQTHKGRFLRAASPPSRFGSIDLKVNKAEYSEDQLRAARLLVVAETRNLMLQLAQIGKIRAADAKLSPEVIGQLVEAQLITKEYLVVCKKDSRTLCQICNLADLSSKLVCPTCQRKFSDELVQDILAITDIGKELLTSSHWMMIWVTDLLVQAGVAKDSIAWNATAGEDEIDLVMEVLGLRIFFELKDREFGLGDAYPFVYRVDRYGASRGVVVSTEKIANEAQKYFQERARSAGAVDTVAGASIETGLRDLVDKLSRLSIHEMLQDLSGRMGGSIAPIVDTWMNRFTSLLLTGQYKAPAPIQAIPQPSSQLGGKPEANQSEPAETGNSTLVSIQGTETETAQQPPLAVEQATAAPSPPESPAHVAPTK